jgi:hypothetical protein
LHNKYLIIIIVLSITIGIYCSYKIPQTKAEIKTDKEIIYITEKFFDSIVNKDLQDLERYATGEPLWKLKTLNSPELMTAEITKTEHQIIEKSPLWAKTQSMIEILGNDYDVGWYEVNLIKETQKTWKIYSVKETTPFCFNEASLKSVPIEQLESIFSQYLSDVIDGKDITKYLAGSVKKGKKSIVLPEKKEIEDIDIVPVRSNGSLVISQVSYELNNKPLQMIVYFYNTPEGWKITSIDEF